MEECRGGGIVGKEQCNAKKLFMNLTNIEIKRSTCIFTALRRNRRTYMRAHTPFHLEASMLLTFFFPLKLRAQKGKMHWGWACSTTTYFHWVFRGVNHHPQGHCFKQQRELLLVNKVSVAVFPSGPPGFSISLFVIPFDRIKLLSKAYRGRWSGWHIRRLRCAQK